MKLMEIKHRPAGDRQVRTKYVNPLQVKDVFETVTRGGVVELADGSSIENVCARADEIAGQWSECMDIVPADTLKDLESDPWGVV